MDGDLVKEFVLDILSFKLSMDDFTLTFQTGGRAAIAVINSPSFR